MRKDKVGREFPRHHSWYLDAPLLTASVVAEGSLLSGFRPSKFLLKRWPVLVVLMLLAKPFLPYDSAIHLVATRVSQHTAGSSYQRLQSRVARSVYFSRLRCVLKAKRPLVGLTDVLP